MEVMRYTHDLHTPNFSGLICHVGHCYAPRDRWTKCFEGVVAPCFRGHFGHDGSLVRGDATVLHPLVDGNAVDLKFRGYGTWAASSADGLLNRVVGLNVGHTLPRKASPNIISQVWPNRKAYPDRMSFGTRIRVYRERLGLSQQEVGDALGVSKTTVSDWENDKVMPRFSRLQALADTLRVLVTELHGEVPNEVATTSTMEPILAWEHQDELPAGDFALVPALNVKLSAGNGHEQIEIHLAQATPLAFKADWIRAKGLKPNKLAAMPATGDSMEPGIFDGDSLLVDTSQTEVIDGKVYALWYDGGERVKRLYRLPGGGLRIKSDNPSHPTIEVSPEHTGHVRVIGRVVHRSGDGGLY